jgi:hypothetical protein
MRSRKPLKHGGKEEAEESKEASKNAEKHGIQSLYNIALLCDLCSSVFQRFRFYFEARSN